MTLMEQAQAAAGKSYSPYSHYAVGAAVRWEDDTVTVGTNVENASYGLTQCAERSAVTAGIVGGLRKIIKVAIWVDDEKAATPCGACRQVLHEFAMEQGVIVQVGNPQGVVEYLLADLLPKAF